MFETPQWIVSCLSIEMNAIARMPTLNEHCHFNENSSLRFSFHTTHYTTGVKFIDSLFIFSPQKQHWVQFCYIYRTFYEQIFIWMERCFNVTNWHEIASFFWTMNALHLHFGKRARERERESEKIRFPVEFFLFIKQLMQRHSVYFSSSSAAHFQFISLVLHSARFKRHNEWKLSYLCMYARSFRCCVLWSFHSVPFHSVRAGVWRYVHFWDCYCSMRSRMDSPALIIACVCIQ